jgi:cytochrome P450
MRFRGWVSAPISLRVLTNFLGVPDEYTARFYRWTNTTMCFGEPGAFKLLRARFALLQIFVQSALLARERRKRPAPSLLPQAIEEMLRWVSPVMQFRRTAMRDTKIGDQEIRKGEKVVMYYGAVNRDPSVFEDPEVFDITRKPNPHLAFGIGTHFCMGSHIARLEVRVTLEEFLRRFPNVSLAGTPERLESNFISSIKRLPIRLV